MLATMEAAPTQRGDWDELADLVRLAQSGDREAFGSLVEQFERTVHAICLRRLGSPVEALELTQEVFIHVLRRIHQLREPERFAGWLRQVTVRMSINRATRRLEPTSVEPAILAEARSRTGEPLDDLIARERAERLWDAMDVLKPIDREALVAFYIQGRSLIDIADELDIPMGTIKRRLHTARRRLKETLEARSVDVDEWSMSTFGDADDQVEESAVARVFELV
ncbi:sigma-70 family RNA polymerase sigma factor [Isosphaeraceae bacterium EP7]